MSDLELNCNDERRRRKVREAKEVNGLDYLEVSNDQLRLSLYFIDRAPRWLKKENVAIEGGRRIRGIKVVGLDMRCHNDPERDDCLTVIVDKPGDFSTYTLKLVEAKDGKPTDKPLGGFDPRYAQLQFSFKVNCPADFDCKQQPPCPPEDQPQPEINYLAKDYKSYNQLIFDRLSLIMPDWKERHAPDIGVAIVEIMAYVGDYLSYYQDAVATEAYLDTARQRISVRRHARLVDYIMHEGCNARAWVTVWTDADIYLGAEDFFFITSYKDNLGQPGSLIALEDIDEVPESKYEAFEPVVEKRSPSVLFSLRDFRNPGSLASAFKHRSSPLSEHLEHHFSATTKRLLDRFDDDSPASDALRQALVYELNRAIKAGKLYSERLFRDVPLSDEARHLIAENPQGEKLARLNRLLLDEAYSHELVRRRFYFERAQNEISFYTWGDTQCCLPRGATSATLKDAWLPHSKGGPSQKAYSPEAHSEDDSPRERYAVTQEYTDEEIADIQRQPERGGQYRKPPRSKRETALRNLGVGDALIFEEVKGAKTHDEADADPSHRHVVRLMSVRFDVDELDDQPVVEIEWSKADALPFALCISSIGPAPECELAEDISVARGNVVLVDHGRRQTPEYLGAVIEDATEIHCEGAGQPSEVSITARRFNPSLKKAPLTFSQPFAADGPAANALVQDARRAAPQVELSNTKPANGDPFIVDWVAQQDLLGSDGEDHHFVAEMDNEGRAHLRFGDGQLGRQPDAGAEFWASYRIGNGPIGNVGAEAIKHIILRHAKLSGAKIRPSNPMPAQGGIAPESLIEAKRIAPRAFRKELQRAITADDYARLAERHPKVQRATAALRWNGSWYEAMVAIDPINETQADDQLLAEIESYLLRFKRIEHDLVVRRASYVPLELGLTVCALPHYLRAHIRAALLDVFSNRAQPGGRRGFFHPDNLTFGEGIPLSKIVAAAQATPGVETAQVVALERLNEGPNQEIENGILPLGPMEIARLDNDPNYPENGLLRLEIRGGR